MENERNSKKNEIRRRKYNTIMIVDDWEMEEKVSFKQQLDIYDNKDLRYIIFWLEERRDDQWLSNSKKKTLTI